MIELTPIGGVVIETNAPTDKILENVKENLKIKRPQVTDNPYWRGSTPIAIVGGGPSLKDSLDELRKYKNILATGSTNDFLLSNGITPNWVAICDPDPLVTKYLQHKSIYVEYLVSSQCDPSVFDHLSGYKVTVWHLYCADKDDKDKPRFDHAAYGPDAVPIGGGCTIGTRAMVLAIGMGFFNLHLFGMDTCVSQTGDRYSYPLQDKEYEESLANDFYDITFEPGGPVFRVLGYHLAQLFDIKHLSRMYAGKMNVTVFGDSLLKYYYELAERKLNELRSQYPNEILTPERIEELTKNGNSTRFDGLGRDPVPGHPTFDEP